MKRSEELKIKKGEKVARMQALTDAAKADSQRALTATETTEFDNLRSEVEALNAEIERAHFLEVNNPPAEQRANEQPAGTFQIKREAVKVYSVGKAIREFMVNGAASLTGVEAEQHQELGRNISSTGLLVPYGQRSASVNNATTNAAQVDVVIDPNLSIIGYEPLYNQMRLTIKNNHAGAIKLGKKTHDVAGKYAESTEIVAESNVPSFVTMVPSRYGITDSFTKELLAQENPAVQAAIVADMIKGCDRKLTADVYAVALAAAGEVAAGAITEAGFNAMAAAVDMDGAFAMDRGSFFAAKGLAIDSGSGLRLAKNGPRNGLGVCHDGVPLYYSNLFDDGAAKQYIIYGAWAELWLGFWGGLEILIDPYTRGRFGEIVMTVNKLACPIVRNSGAFKKSPDLDSAT